MCPQILAQAPYLSENAWVTRAQWLGDIRAKAKVEIKEIDIIDFFGRLLLWPTLSRVAPPELRMGEDAKSFAI
jgi:hypothetical protein